MRAENSRNLEMKYFDNVWIDQVIERTGNGCRNNFRRLPGRAVFGGKLSKSTSLHLHTARNQSIYTKDFRCARVMFTYIERV